MLERVCVFSCIRCECVCMHINKNAKCEKQQQHQQQNAICLPHRGARASKMYSKENAKIYDIEIIFKAQIMQHIYFKETAPNNIKKLDNFFYIFL